MQKPEILLGNDHIKEILKKGLFHAYLIEGEKGSGRHTLARLITYTALCSAESKPCGVCAGCKKLDADSHLDFIRIPSDIKAEALREVLNDVSIYPSEGEKKVYIIDNAERLSVRCQNILLKTLEEPPEFVIFILICRSKQSMLETILSRCMVFSMSPIPADAIERFLKNKYGDRSDIRRAALLSGGFIGVAEDILNQTHSSRFLQCEKFFEAYLAHDLISMSDLLNIRDRTEFCAYVQELCDYVKRIIGYAVSGLPDGVDNTERALCGVGLSRLCGVCDVLDKCAQNSMYNINIPLWSICVAKDIMNI